MLLNKQLALEANYAKTTNFWKAWAEDMLQEDRRNKDVPADWNNPMAIKLIALLGEHKKVPLGTVIAILSSPETLKEDLPLLEDCLKVGICKESYGSLQNIYTIEEHVQEQWDRCSKALPLVVPPKILKTPWENGYHSLKGGVLLKEKIHKDLPLDNLNLSNAIPLSLVPEVVEKCSLGWENMDSPADGETQYAFMRRKEAAKAFIARMEAFVKDSAGNPIWVINQYDKRGRIYACGYHINPQGNDFQKHCLQLYTKEIISK